MTALTGDADGIAKLLIQTYASNTGCIEQHVPTLELCKTCRQPVDDYQYCPSCSGHRKAAIESRVELANRVAFFTYAWISVPNGGESGKVKSGQQMYHSLQLYKELGAGRENGSPYSRVYAMLWTPLNRHGKCLTAVSGQKPTHFAVVPSSRDIPRDALACIVEPNSPWLTKIATSAKGPKDRTFSPGRIAIEEAQGIKGSHVVLFEDTWVTGGSAQSTAAALKLAGASEVSIIAIARALNWEDWEPTRKFFTSHPERNPYDLDACPFTDDSICPSRD